MTEKEIVQQAAARYAQMMTRGMCCHAAAASGVSAVYQLAKDAGYTLDETQLMAGRFLQTIREMWEDK